MASRRTLTLKREVLQELTPDALAGVAGGARTTGETLYSCMAFVSCAIPFCLLADTTLCVE